MRNKGGNLLTSLTGLVLVIVVAIVVVVWLTSSLSPFNRQPPAPAAISIGQIQKQYKMETAEVTSSTAIEGETKNALPFSSEKFIYQIYVTLTAGIDLEQMKDGDIVVSGDSVTVRLPQPKILRAERSGKVLWHNREVFSGFSENPNLLEEVQQEGVSRVTKTVLEQGELIRKAKINAEDNVRNLILQLGYKNVVFTYADTPITPAPVSTAKPK